SLSELAALQSIATALDRQGDLEAMAAAREIELLIKVTRRSYGVHGDVPAAQDFLEKLAADPAAEIGASATPIVERLDPGIPRGGVEDGTKYFNLGSPEPSAGGLPNAYISTPEAQLATPAPSTGLEEWLQSSSPTWMPSPRVPG